MIGGMSNLWAIWRDYWREVFHGAEYPTAEVREALSVTEEALDLARRLRKNPPDYNKQILDEVARLLGA